MDSRGFDSIDDIYLRATALLTFTAPPFEYPRSDWLDKVHMVGPGTWDPPEQGPEWLDDIDAPLILVTCSSEFQNDGKLISTAIKAFRDEDVHVVVTSAGVDPDDFNAPRNFTIRSLIPHRPLLERAECVICHGGMGITQKSLSFGVRFALFHSDGTSSKLRDERSPREQAFVCPLGA